MNTSSLLLTLLEKLKKLEMSEKATIGILPGENSEVSVVTSHGISSTQQTSTAGLYSTTQAQFSYDYQGALKYTIVVIFFYAIGMMCMIIKVKFKDKSIDEQKAVDKVFREINEARFQRAHAKAAALPHLIKKSVNIITAINMPNGSDTNGNSRGVMPASKSDYLLLKLNKSRNQTQHSHNDVMSSSEGKKSYRSTVSSYRSSRDVSLGSVSEEDDLLATFSDGDKRNDSVFDPL